LTELRGKIVLLDFWTSCCVNCLHVLDELRELEERYSDVLVTIGVHSPKFAHEADPDAVDAAVERYGVHHPVLDDPDLVTWDAYAARAWPTLAVIDPAGYVVAQVSGEGHAHELAVLVEGLIVEHADVLRRGDGPYVATPVPRTHLRYPGKVISLRRAGDRRGTFLVSDTAHHQLVELEDDLVTGRRRIGDGERGLVDNPDGGGGGGAAARFAEPQGLVLLPATVAARVGYDVVVADTVNHALRGVRLAGGAVSTVAGTGEQLRTGVGVGGSADELSTPWDVVWWGDRVVVAMAGSHQLWSFDPLTGDVVVLAGTTDEGLRDGPPGAAFLAQPSGLAVARPPVPATAAGDTAAPPVDQSGQEMPVQEARSSGLLWFVDAETSALRSFDAAPAVGAAVTTAVGQGLFDFGHRDGPADAALLQHPLGVSVLPDGSIAIADTYNGAVRRYDPATRTVDTLARELREPSDLVVDGDTLVVVESAAHRLVRVPIPASARVAAGAHVRRTRTDLSPGDRALTVVFVPPTGQHLDTRFGDPTRLTVVAAPHGLLASGAGAAPGLTRELRFAADGPAEGALRVSAAAAACDSGDGVLAACHRHQQEWDIPVRVVPGAPAELTLDLHAR